MQFAMVRKQDEIRIRPAEDGTGVFTSFPFDAATVERFRDAFPRARWRDEDRAWFVPGKTADRRVANWLARQLPASLAFADQRGHDAFAFEPIDSRYLEADDDILVRTPYSRTVIELVRQVPWAAWDEEERVWRIPFRSLDALRLRWPAIEEAALRAEPEKRRARREAQKLSPDYEVIRESEMERRRRRFPLLCGHVPPLETVVMTPLGAVVFTGSHGELVGPSAASSLYGSLPGMEERVWAFWRSPRLAELIRTPPARRPPDEAERLRGWWQPTLAELRSARRTARSRERAQATRAQLPEKD